jgi:hypothetical protein
MPHTALACQTSKMGNSDTCPRPTAGMFGGGGRAQGADGMGHKALSRFGEFVETFTEMVCTAQEFVRECHAGRSRQGAQGAHLNPLGLFLEPPGPLLTHPHTVCMACSEHLPTRLNPPG